MVLVSYAPLEVGVHGLLYWCSIGGSRSYLHRPVIMSRHPLKIVFPSYCTYMECFSSVTVHSASRRGTRLRRLFIILGSVESFLALAYSLRIILR